MIYLCQRTALFPKGFFEDFLEVGFYSSITILALIWTIWWERNVRIFEVQLMWFGTCFSLPPPFWPMLIYS